MLFEKRCECALEWGQLYLRLSFGDVNRRFYGQKLRLTFPLTGRRRKMKFTTIKPTIYISKWHF